MGNLSRRLAITAGVVIALFALNLTSAGQAIAQGIKPLFVQVVNTADTPVPTRDLNDSAARTAFSEQIHLSVPGDPIVDFSIPAGKRLVVECVSVSGFDSRDGGAPAIALVAVLAGSPRTSYHLTPIEVEPSGVLVPAGDSFAFTEVIRLYADVLSVHIGFGGDSTNVGSFDVTVSGYLVDQP